MFDNADNFKYDTQFVHFLILLGDRLDDDLSDTLDGMLCHFKRKLFINLGDNGLIVSDKVDGIELALCRALSAADTHIGVDLSGTAS